MSSAALCLPVAPPACGRISRVSTTRRHGFDHLVDAMPSGAPAGFRTDSSSVWARCGNEFGVRKSTGVLLGALTWNFPVVGTGVDPVTSRFSSMKECVCQAAPARRDGSVRSWRDADDRTRRRDGPEMHRVEIIGQGSQGRPKAARRGNLDGPITVLSDHVMTKPSGASSSVPS
jgi:hypothetical protein